MLNLLQKRRSIRNYTGKEVPGEKIQAILQAALLSPTSKNSRAWEFILVDKEELLEKLSRAKSGGAEFVSGADAAIVVAADPGESDVWIEDCAIAATNMHNMAAELGLGSCWVQIRRRQREDGGSSEKYVREVLDLPPVLRVDCLLAVGWPEEEKSKRELSELPYEKIHYNCYGEDSPY